MKKLIVRERQRSKSVYEAARSGGLSHLQADILCRRDVSSLADLTPFFDPKLREIPAPHLLKNCNKAVGRIVRAIKKGENIGLVTDYDVDGLTAHAVAKKALNGFLGRNNGQINSFVGDRLQDGYGLTDQLCSRILANTPAIDLVITADCGVSDEKRIAVLKEAGIDVIITDHHLVPEDEFPCSAYTLVDPQQEKCLYPDKAISGCMVCWLVMSAVRTSLVEDGSLPTQTPTLISLLDYVALSTIADSVSLLSATNRAVVRYGLKEINTFARHCWRSMQFGGAPVGKLTEEDLAYQVSPRINGAGRMADPQLALDFLLAEGVDLAKQYFEKLTKVNDLRKKSEAKSRDIANGLLEETDTSKGIVAYHTDFHPGILGILASRLAEKHGVPAVVFGNTPHGEVLAGSCRTGGGVHILNILAQTADMEQRANQENIISFGGHKGAAGIKIFKQGLDLFRENFLKAIDREEIDNEGLAFLDTDGALALENINLATVDEINKLAPFGQHFEHPVFSNEFSVDSAKFVGKDKDHLQLILCMGTSKFRAIWFRARTKSKQTAESIVPGCHMHCVYQLAGNEFRGKRQLQLCISDVSG